MCEYFLLFQDNLEVEKKDILNRLANARKEDVKHLAKKTTNKDEILRIKREIHSNVSCKNQIYLLFLFFIYSFQFNCVPTLMRRIT